MARYPRYQPDLNGKRPEDCGSDDQRFVVVLGSDPLLPLVAHVSEEQAYHMAYKRFPTAEGARDRVRGVTTWGNEVRVYDKSQRSLTDAI